MKIVRTYTEETDFKGFNTWMLENSFTLHLGKRDEKYTAIIKNVFGNSGLDVVFKPFSRTDKVFIGTGYTEVAAIGDLINDIRGKYVVFFGLDRKPYKVKKYPNGDPCVDCRRSNCL